MEPIKGIYSCIFELNEEEFKSLFSRFYKDECTECDKQLYLYYDRKRNKYLAIDNSDGYMYIEEFTIRKDAFIWLFGLQDAGPLQKAEEFDFWW